MNFKLVFLFASIVTFLSLDIVAQNGIIGAGFTNGWTNPNDMVCFNAGIGTTRIYTDQANGTGNQYFRMVRCWGGDNSEFGPNPCSADELVTVNTGTTYDGVGCGQAFYINVSSVGDYYIFKTADGASGVSFLVMQTAATPANILSAFLKPDDCSDAGAAAPAKEVVVTLNAVPSAGEHIYIRYTTNGFTTSNLIEVTGFSGSPVQATGIIPSLPAGASVEYYVFSSTLTPAQIGTNYDLAAINYLNNAGQNYCYTSTIRNCTFGDDCDCQYIKTFPTLDGNIDANKYQHIVEDPYAGPMAGGSTVDSDFPGESSARIVTYDVETNNYNDICSLNWGTADVKQFYVTWDNDYLWMVVGGPSAYHEYSGRLDRMDLFVAIDTDNNTNSTTPSAVTLTNTQAPKSKKVDFAGWDPEYFFFVEQIGPNPLTAPATDGGDYAALFSAGSGTPIVEDRNAGAEGAGVSFDFRSIFNGCDGTTEVRIPWGVLGGRPTNGATWNFAIYTTYDDDGYDIYDSGPGNGQGSGSPYEQVGDSPYDSDYCGGAVDPVTGVSDAHCSLCQVINGSNTCHSVNADAFNQCADGQIDNGPGSNNAAAQPGSDNEGSDFDTVHGYYQIQKMGALTPDAGDINTTTITTDFNICQGTDLLDFTAASAAFIADYNAFNEDEPPTYFGYAFLLTNAAGTIVDVIYGATADFDFTSLVAGTYSVYGLSYGDTNTPANIVNYIAMIRGDGTANDISQIDAHDIGTAYCLDLDNLNVADTEVQIIIDPVSVVNVTGTCNADGTANITVSATISAGTLEYNIDGGAFQASNIFNNVASGAHSFEVRVQSTQCSTITNTNISCPAAPVCNPGQGQFWTP